MENGFSSLPQKMWVRIRSKGAGFPQVEFYEGEVKRLWFEGERSLEMSIRDDAIAC